MIDKTRSLMKFSEMEGGLFTFYDKLFLKINESKVSHGICAIQLIHKQNEISLGKVINNINYFKNGEIEPVSFTHENDSDTQSFKTIALNSLFMVKSPKDVGNIFLCLKIDSTLVNNIAEALELKNGAFFMYNTNFIPHVQQKSNYPVQKVTKFELN